jgi:TetR/AcrR family transcriptional regulator, transcriptional repressor for nem operon
MARVEDTRRKLLEAAFAEFHLHGFQAASLDAIVERAGVTKGALYHHFPHKSALGHAVIDEVVREPLLEAYLGPLEQSTGDPLAAIQHTLRRRADDFVAGGIELGCPLNNLTQEMSPLDEEFRARVAAMLESWTDAYARALDRAQQQGFIRPNVETRPIAGLIVAAVEGSFGVAKAAQSVDRLRSNLDALANLLEGLRPAA